jgi:hypothetical protein
MNTIKKILSKRISKGIVSILLFMGVFLSIVSSRSTEHSWWTFHCIVSNVWYLLMLVHIWQHWTITKLTLQLNQKALKRNKITLMTIVIFILMTFSVISFIFRVNDILVEIHHYVAHVFYKLMIIHTIAKWKQLVACFR